ncbi:16S rRNA (adenine(1518)-N(6)/adenine(1519)-N(6))-dimethyltransferase RsmA [Aquibaculum sediminis]|uniref:16S rRNA (adenine(1518)-N(6)/adenine(1519)-N(6))- dimethyltransferase RsmA n=1 Tax=Aquibaculum sediminis TaxID=3231907 RepID=UPI003F5FF4CD
MTDQSPEMTSDPVAALPPLREVIAQHELAARKSLGQHFLLDLNLTRRITRLAAPMQGATVIEVGPGPGGLTRALLLEGAERLIAVEKDRRCQVALASLVEASDKRLSLIEADALRLPLADLGTAPRMIVSNLPYNIGTALLTAWLQQIAVDPAVLDRLVLMFQKEVAERLVAAPRSKAYGRLAVFTQWLCEADIVFDIPASAFTPPPKVVSSVVLLRPRAQPLAPCRLSDLERVTAAAFGQRRKMLRQSLKGLGVSPALLLQDSGIAETARAEELSVEEFCLLARKLQALSEQEAD